MMKIFDNNDATTIDKCAANCEKNFSYNQQNAV